MPSNDKIGMINMLLYSCRWFRICSDLIISFRIGLMVFLRKTVILETLTLIALKHILIINIGLMQNMITVPDKPLFSVLSYLWLLSLQAKTRLRKSVKGILNCCKLQIVFKSQNQLSNALCFKDCIPKEHASSVI